MDAPEPGAWETRAPAGAALRRLSIAPGAGSQGLHLPLPPQSLQASWGRCIGTGDLPPTRPLAHARVTRQGYSQVLQLPEGLDVIRCQAAQRPLVLDDPGKQQGREQDRAPGRVTGGRQRWGLMDGAIKGLLPSLFCSSQLLQAWMEHLSPAADAPALTGVEGHGASVSPETSLGLH